MWDVLLMAAVLLLAFWCCWEAGRIHERLLSIRVGRRRAADMVNAINAGLAAPEGEQLDRMLEAWERRRW